MPSPVRAQLTERLRALLVCLVVMAGAAACGTAAVTSGPTSPATLPASSRSPAGTPATSATCPVRTLAGMTEAQRVGQLFLLGIEGDRLAPGETAAIENYHLGSVWLVNRRTGGIDGVRPLTVQIEALATESTTHLVSFFIGADQEGGRIQLLTGPGFTTIPSALEQGRLAPEILQEHATQWGRELSTAGVNLDFAPVMDVVPPGGDATNQPIGMLQREYGHDPTTVGSHGAAVIDGMDVAGIPTTLKHFPGLGRVVGNTDTASGVVDSVTTADDPYLEAFRTGIQARAPFVMVSLATYSAIDPNHQAVFSSTIIGSLLRGRLGFEGVVMSDDLGATASVSTMAPGDRATEFIDAGGDLMIVRGVDAAGRMAAAVLDRAGSDPAFAAKVDAAALYVLRAKDASRLLRCG